MHLLKLRASQINGCAYCIDMHAIDARAAGETEQRLYALDAWRETPFFDDRERAALAWIEAVTLVAQGHVPDAVYEEARAALQREGAGRPDLSRRDDQCVEPPGDFPARRAGALQGRPAARRRWTFSPHAASYQNGAPAAARRREADRSAAVADRPRVGHAHRRARVERERRRGTSARYAAAPGVRAEVEQRVPAVRRRAAADVDKHSGRAGCAASGAVRPSAISLAMSCRRILVANPGNDAAMRRSMSVSGSGR